MSFRRTRAERQLMILLNHPDLATDLQPNEVEALLAKGAKAETILPPDGGSFLALSSIWGNVGVARVLLAHGADPDGNQLRRDVPLHIAVQNAHTEFTDLLLDAGADVNACNSRGETALFVAVTMDKPRRSAMPEKLLRAGIDPSIRDKTGQTALETYEHSTRISINSSYERDNAAQLLAEFDRIRALLAH